MLIVDTVRSVTSGVRWIVTVPYCESARKHHLNGRTTI
jgi:hypothetical protein